MIPSDSLNANHSVNEWDEWLNTSAGQYALHWEQKQFNLVVDDSFGFDALQIGMPHLSCLKENRIPNRWIMLLDSQSSIKLTAQDIPVICQSSIYDLPFANESLDLVTLPHVLEFSENPHEALREIHRILRPEGRIVISGFNPISLWGARQFTGRVFHQPFLPKEGQFISHLRIKDWLNLLNYSIDRGKFGCYGIPLKNSNPIKTVTLLDKLGDRWWPFFGSVFMLSAIKRHPGVKLVGKIQTKRPLINQQLKPATQANTSKELIQHDPK